MAAKTSRKPKRKAPKYHRLTREQRIIIETLRKEGYSIRPIAVRLGVSPATVSRKLRRNRSKKGYRNRKADAMARHRARQKAGKRRKLTEQMWSYAMEKVRLGWSFAMACGRAGRDGVEMVCAEALYKEYYRRQKLVAEGKSQQKLPPLPKSHRKRHKRGRSSKEAGRGHIPGRVDISERPESVESRARGGHFEGDLINGLHGTGNLVTLAERMTRFTFFDYVESKESEAVMEVVLKLLGPLPPDLLKTLTFDNGKEFARFRGLEALGLKVYFARPYHSWERGTNENRNGIIRKVLPKGTAFNDLTEEQRRRIDYLLNDRPMRCLNWRTPREAFARLVLRVLGAAVV